MIIRKGSSFLALILVLGLGVTAFGQGRRNQQQGGGNEGGGGGTSIAPKAANEVELKAFNAFQAEQNPATKLTLGDSFLTTYPTSELTGYVQRYRMESLTRLGKFQDAIAAGEAGLNFETKFLDDLQARTESKDKNTRVDKNSPDFKSLVDQTQKAKLFYYQLMMNAYQQLNNAEKTIEFGEKALKENPENLAALITVSSVMTERPPTDDKQKEERMKVALEHAKKAEAKVTERLAAAGAQMSEAQKADLLSSVHQTLGLANLHLKKYADAQKEYLSAIAARKDDPVSYYRLGLAYSQDKKLDQGMEALAKSVFLKGVSETEARTALTNIWKASNKPADGLEDYIKTAGAKIGQ